MARGTLDAFVVPAAEALAVVGDMLDADNGAELLANLGYKVPGGSDLPGLFTDVATSTGELADALTAVIEAYEADGGEGDSFLPKIAALAEAVAHFADAVQRLVSRADAAFAAAADFLANAPLDDLPRRLLDFLIAGYLRRQRPRIAATLNLLGVIEDTFIEEGEYNPDFTLIRVEWERLPRWLTDPGSVLADAYGWRSARFDDAKLLERLTTLLWMLGVPGRYVEASSPEAPAELELPVYEATIDVPPDGLAGIEAGVRLRRAENPADRDDAGLGLVPFVEGMLATELPLREGWGLLLMAALDAEGLEISVHPVSGVQLDVAGQLTGKAGITLARHQEVLGPLILLGDPAATRLELGDLAVAMFAAFDSDGDADVGFELRLGGLAIVIQGGDGDGFLSKVLPADPMRMSLDLVLGVTRKRGFYFGGGAEFEYTFQLNVAIGPLFVDAIDVRAKLGTGAIAATIAVTGGLEIGPLVAIVKGIGLVAKVALGQPGNLGPADLSLGFKPPEGIGMSIDTSTLRLGGFLLIDAERGRYVGAIELAVMGKFELTAIGLITTRMPDGSDGFSLLFIISIVFPVPIPLSYNFYFAGAGGLLGLNRSIDLDRLTLGLRSGAADSILFPTDVVRRMDAIVRDLEAVFPVAQGQFLVGPMAMITWSSPPLITLKLGIILEIGTPIRIGILGVLQAILPDPESPIISIKVAFLGSIDLGAGLLAFDASIYDSFIGVSDFKLSLEGDIAVRLSWGPQPEFLLSVGGFHPTYKPAAYLKLPPMRRLSLSLLKDNPSIKLSTYFAITSNTIQLGAQLDLRFEVSGFSVLGDLGFDVLLQFSPFSLQADIHARVAVKAGGTDLLAIQLDFTLTGPTPWVARGAGRFKVLCFEVKVRFEKRFGEELLTSRPDIAVLPAVTAELERDAVWRGELGDATTSLVQLLPPGPGAIVVDAAGAIAVSQRVLPLDTEFSLFGPSRPTDAQLVRIKELRLGAAAAGTSPLTDAFAPAAFREMSDPDKLAAPAYEQRPSGVVTAGDHALRADHVVRRDVAYEVLISDLAGGDGTQRLGRLDEPRAQFEALVPGGAAGRSALARDRTHKAEAGRVVDAAGARERFGVTTLEALRPLDSAGRPAAPVSVDPDGRPTYAAGVVLPRSDAEARLAALAGPLDLQIVPEAQLV